MLELVVRTSSDLPRDVERAIRRGMRREFARGAARWVMETILKNIGLARRRRLPLCQDTGAPAFFCRVPHGFDTRPMEAAMRRAVRAATRAGVLRRNTLETIGGRSLDDNIGPGFPAIHISRERRGDVDVRLLLKGGGSENVCRQYSLPDASLGAERDLDGARKCALDAVARAQGNGCAPGVLGICVGGDRAAGMDCARRQFLRLLDDVSPVAELAAFERRLLRECNSLGIGPMGLGGGTTLLAVKAAALPRLPACYFVSAAYICWAMRRRGALFAADGTTKKWIYP